MKISKKHVFNLMDTNGRRNDVINALQGYLSILNDVTEQGHRVWGSIPQSFTQYRFYQAAIKFSPDVFKTHIPYDDLQAELEHFPELREAIIKGNKEYLYNLSPGEATVLSHFDKGIEDRARHYTSNLVKLGFADSDRFISEVGKLLLHPNEIKKDPLEQTLPINGINLIYLRQLLKLRVFSKDEDTFYSPFLMALYCLLSKIRMSENEFLEIVQGGNPYSTITNLDQYISYYNEGDVVSNYNIKIPNDLHVNGKIDQNSFQKYFTNKKSRVQIDIYWNFYTYLEDFNINQDTISLERLLNYYEDEKAALNKAFGRGKNIFINRKGTRPEPAVFIKNNSRIFKRNLNEYLYSEFCKSKQLDSIREYSDTTKRIFKATGMISFDNGYVELAYRELCQSIFSLSLLEKMVYGNISEETDTYYDSYADYEEGADSFFCSVTSLQQFFDYTDQEVNIRLQSIQQKFGGKDFRDIPEIIAKKRSEEFLSHLKTNYPIPVVKKLLELFSDRRNDNMIRERVSPDATVPTIYEFIVGIAWYYFSNETIDLLNSYNLTLSANFEPLLHAGGGQGDIVIYEPDKVIMLEATLMNPNSQKRGEWEPVLRHSVNLKAQEDASSSNRSVTTFFIADRFDANTINIWKAIASVPMQSSMNNRFTENVIIMPINNTELSSLIDLHEQYNEIIEHVRNLFISDDTNFNLNWRTDFINEICK